MINAISGGGTAVPPSSEPWLFSQAVDAAAPPPNAQKVGDEAAKHFAQTASSTEGRDSLIRALTGQSFQQATPEQKRALTTLFDNVANGQFHGPEFVFAARSDTPDLAGNQAFLLPQQLNGAFAPSANIALLATDLSGVQLTSTAHEEFGEAVAYAAQQSGLSLPSGDVGERLGRAVLGEVITPAKTPDLYVDHTGTNDTFSARVNGKTVLVKGDVYDDTAIQSNAILYRRSSSVSATTSFLYQHRIDFLSKNAEWSLGANNVFESKYKTLMPKTHWVMKGLGAFSQNLGGAFAQIGQSRSGMARNTDNPTGSLMGMMHNLQYDFNMYYSRNADGIYNESLMLYFQAMRALEADPLFLAEVAASMPEAVEKASMMTWGHPASSVAKALESELIARKNHFNYQSPENGRKREFAFYNIVETLKVFKKEPLTLLHATYPKFAF